MFKSFAPDALKPIAVDKTLSTIIRAICFFWFIVRIKSHKIWMLGDRLYPSIPVFDFLDGFPPIILVTLYYITMFCLLFLVFKPHQAVIQITLFLSVFIAAIFEMTAWQPWEYQYLCMIAVIILNKRNPAALYTALILIMGCIYFYSGLQKFNGGFLHSVWKGLILRKFFGITDVNLFIHYLGLTLALFEALLGLGILFSRHKRYAAYLLIAMHFFILVLLGTVQGFNIVLPWNIVMIIILHVLFIQKSTEFTPSLLFKNRNIIIFLLWAIMPLLSFFGYWEQKFSSNLFSGKYKNLVVCTTGNLPKELTQFTVDEKKKRQKICKEKQRLSISKWTIDEMSVLPPTSDIYYLKFKREISRKYNNVNFNCYAFIYPYSDFPEIK